MSDDNKPGRGEVAKAMIVRVCDIALPTLCVWSGVDEMRPATLVAAGLIVALQVTSVQLLRKRDRHS